MKLLNRKHDELSSKIKRLENGLEKLNSTALQVAELKKTLAIQEIELKEKNDAADALIEIVRIETEKVQASTVARQLFVESVCKHSNGIEDIFCTSAMNSYTRLVVWFILRCFFLLSLNMF